MLNILYVTTVGIITTTKKKTKYKTKQNDKKKDTLQSLKALVYFRRKLGFCSKCHTIYTLKIHEVTHLTRDEKFDTRQLC